MAIMSVVKFKFDYSAKKLSLLNALLLLKAADLAYNELSQIQKNIAEDFGLLKYKLFDSHDTQAFISANDKIIVVAFRGTTSINDWVTDLKVKLVRSAVGCIHCGFNEALDWIWGDLKKSILDFRDKEQSIWITGHSLGGALATLTVDRLTEDSVKVNGLYTFGQPKVGDKLFCYNFDYKMKGCAFRFVHDEDGVPKVPTFIQGYQHIGTECFFDRDDNLFIGDVWLKKFVSLCTSVAIRSSENADKLRAQNPGSVRDHDLGHYERCIRKNYIKQNGPPENFIDYINS